MIDLAWQPLNFDSMAATDPPGLVVRCGRDVPCRSGSSSAEIFTLQHAVDAVICGVFASAEYFDHTGYRFLSLLPLTSANPRPSR